MIENRHLRYFLVLADTLHMTRAAKLLHIAQPALTQNIQQLEDELGTLLIRRRGHKLSLTEAGKVFRIEAERSLQQFELVKISAQRTSRGEIGELTIGFGSTAGIDVVPQLVRSLHEGYPDIRVNLEEMGTAAQLAALRSGEIDVAISYGVLGDEFQSKQLTTEPLFVALPRDHRLASQDSVPIKELINEKLILPSRQTSVTYYDTILQEYAGAGFQPASIQEVTTIQTSLGLVAIGFGVSIIPASACRILREGTIVLPLQNSRSKARLLLIWKRDDVSPVVQRLIDLVSPKTKKHVD
jgi:DNA-binding transcriptional LysR family regulator